MRTLIIALLASLGLFIAASASAGIDTSNIKDNFAKLTEAQKAAIAAQVEEQAKQNNVNPVNGVVTAVQNVDADDVEPWLKLIDKVGQGLVQLAKDLGVTANELLRTPVGLVTVGLVAYHVMGAEVLGIFKGLLFLAVSLPVWFVFVRKFAIPLDHYATVKRRSIFGTLYETQIPIRQKPDWNEPGAWFALLGIVLVMLITTVFVA